MPKKTSFYMILSQTSEYAIRAAAYIALFQDKGAVRAKDMSRAIDIPQHYLSKVLRKLVNHSLLVATKGHSGGFVLSRPPKSIRLVNIIEAVETSIPTKHCIFGWRMCSSKEPCVLHHRWSKVNEAFQRWARTTTLEDVRKDAMKTNWIIAAECEARLRLRELNGDDGELKNARRERKRRQSGE